MNVCIKTLGCKVNTYESEYIKQLFLINNYNIVQKDAHIYVVNTCTVTNTSDAKSKKIIRKIRRENPNAILIVVGCFTQYLKYESQNVIDADIILGNKDKSKIITYLNEYLKNKKKIIKFYDDFSSFEDMEINKFNNRTRAFVKIQDGCENFCSYCIIPYVRGKVRSKQVDKVIKEINCLVLNTHKEIVLTGIHTGHYGSDLDSCDFYRLLCLILENKSLYRLRISSIEVTEINDNILNLFKENKVLARHFHIPLQSGCSKILKSMNRKYDVEYFKNKIEQIKKISKDVSITTDVIVGFPGETEEDFMKTYDFCKKMEFSKIHVFPYSERKNTKASFMKNKVKEKDIKKRKDMLLSLSKELENKYYSKYLNKELEVLVEEYKNGYYIAHTSNYLKVYLKEEVKINEVYKVYVTEVKKDCLYAKLVIVK